MWVQYVVSQMIMEFWRPGYYILKRYTQGQSYRPVGSAAFPQVVQ